MNDLDTLRPEVRGLGPCKMCGATGYSMSFGGPDICPVCDCGANPDVTRFKRELAEARAELLRLANENFGMHLALSEHDALCEQSTTYRLRAERAEGDCNDLRKRLNDAISERNTIRRERAQEHRKRARERAELAALKARMKPCAQVVGGEVRALMAPDDEGKYVAVLVVEE